MRFWTALLTIVALGLVLTAPQSGQAQAPAVEESLAPPPPPPPPPAPPLSAPAAKPPKADPGYTTVQDAPAKSPFVEEKSPAGAAKPGAPAGPGAQAYPLPSDPSDPTCGESCDSYSPCGEVCDEQWRLFDCPCLDCARIEIRGWLEQGITTNAWTPRTGFNGPVTFNDRANEYQMNQLYLYAERKVDTACRDWDVGGRVDLLYGTDHRFTTAFGLEDDVNRGSRFYGLAIPQLYLDVAYRDLTVRMGHFYTIIGYEVVPATGNFFYSHSYTMQYSMPFTHTGLLGIYKLNDCWSLSGGFHRGWDTWNDNNTDLGVLGGVNWTSCDQRTKAAFAITVSNEDPAAQNTRTMYDLYLSRRLTDRLTWVIEHALGTEERAVRQTQSAAWFSIVNYLFYDLNDCWSLGLRYEWFDDQDGVRVIGIGDPTSSSPRGYVHPWQTAPRAADWNEVAAGVNYKPNSNVVFRSELRWDWQVPRVSGVQPGFNDYRDRTQFLWGNDLIVKF